MLRPHAPHDHDDHDHDRDRGDDHACDVHDQVDVHDVRARAHQRGYDDAIDHPNDLDVGESDDDLPSPYRAWRAADYGLGYGDGLPCR